MHLFEDVGGLKYVAEATYLDHHVEERPDRDGRLRNAFVFELDLTYPGQTRSEATFVREHSPSPKSREMWTRPMEELRKLAKEQPLIEAAPTERKRIVHIRSEAVRIYVLRRAQWNVRGVPPARTFHGQ